MLYLNHWMAARVHLTPAFKLGHLMHKDLPVHPSVCTSPKNCPSCLSDILHPPPNPTSPSSSTNQRRESNRLFSSTGFVWSYNMSTVIFGISVKQFEHGSVRRKQIVLAPKFCLLRRKFLGKAFQEKSVF